MGSGTDIAMKAAAVVLMKSSLRQIPEIFELSAITIRVIKENLFWAFFYNTVGISLAIAGILNPILAAGAMLVSSISVIANSLRLANRSLDADRSPRIAIPKPARERGRPLEIG